MMNALRGLAGRVHWPGGRLRWQLARSYVLVTLVVALLFEFALVLSSYSQRQAFAGERPLMAEALEEVAAPQVEPYLDRAPPSRAALQLWVAGFLNTTISYTTAKSPASSATLASPLVVWVLDRQGHMVASAANLGATPEATALVTSLVASSEARAVVSAALAGDSEPAHLARAMPQDRTALAAPVRAPDGAVLGVLCDVEGYPHASFGLWDVVELTLFLGVLASLIGTAFGLVASRGIVRRLRRLARAAHTWSHGDFQVEVLDRSRDELGQLARDFNSMAEQLQAQFAARRELATVEERQRLARDLHDSIKQDVFAAALLVGAARTLLPPDQVQAQAYLAEAEALGEHTRQELTALIHELRPVALKGQGLVTSLGAYVRRWSLRTGIVVEIAAPNDLSVPAGVGLALLRVAQEALANSARHSHADQVSVGLGWENEGHLCLRVCDNGTGFDAAQAQGAGVGLASMRERVEALGGTFTISSGTAGSGTTVRACIPLGTPAPAQEEVGV
jgi:NarL family two-component system sensor histidine kinase LiaS